jgi:hypothetical protein
MKIRTAEFEHPTQASRLRLSVFEHPKDSPVSGMPQGGFLVLEERLGASKMAATLGAFASRDEALALMDQRMAELQAQRWTTTSAARA